MPVAVAPARSDPQRKATHVTMTPASLTAVLLLLLSIMSEAKQTRKADKPRQPPPPPSAPPPSAPPPRRARHRSVPGSGELSTKDSDRCVWHTSGEGLVSLTVNCTTDTSSYWCRYAGKPDLCEAYGLKSSQYWKQLVGKLKKRHNACEGEKVLKAKTCKKSPAEAHMKLAQHSSDRDQMAGRRNGAPKSSETKTERRKKKEEAAMGSEDMAPALHEDGMLSDMAPVQSYCGEGWHSVCAFFLRFFEG